MAWRLYAGLAVGALALVGGALAGGVVYLQRAEEAARDRGYSAGWNDAERVFTSGQLADWRKRERREQELRGQAEAVRDRLERERDARIEREAALAGRIDTLQAENERIAENARTDLLNALVRDGYGRELGDGRVRDEYEARLRRYCDAGDRGAGICFANPAAREPGDAETAGKAGPGERDD